MNQFSRLLSQMLPRSPSSAPSVLAALLTTASAVGYATMLEVSIDTTTYDGTDGILAFDFLDGDWLVNNSVTVRSFYTDGTLGVATPTGSTSGSLVSPDSVTLTDADFYNSLSQEIHFGSSIYFMLEITEQGSGRPTPDSFSVFLLDNTEMPLFPTTDFTGADALFAVDIDGTPTGNLQVFSGVGTSSSVTWAVQAPSAVPIPGTAWLLGSALLGGLAARHRRREGSPSTNRNFALDA